MTRSLTASSQPPRGLLRRVNRFHPGVDRVPYISGWHQAPTGEGRELGRLHAITLAGPAGTVVQTTEPTTAQAGILRACGLASPPRITTLDPA